MSSIAYALALHTVTAGDQRAALILQAGLGEVRENFTNSNLGDARWSGPVDDGAAEPQPAVAHAPVLSPAGLPLQPRAQVTASARVPGERAPTVTASGRTNAQVTRRALVSIGGGEGKDHQQQHRGALTKHVSYPTKPAWSELASQYRSGMNAPASAPKFYSG